MIYLIFAHFCAWYFIAMFMRYTLTMTMGDKGRVTGSAFMSGIVFGGVSFLFHLSLYKIGLVPLLFK